MAAVTERSTRPVSARKIAALPVLGTALTLAAFGIVRGASDLGIASGTRLTVEIGAPVDAAARTMAAHVVRERLDEKGLPVRVIAAGDRLIVEVGTQDAEMLGPIAAILERRAMLDLRSNDVVVDPAAVRTVRVDGPAVELDVRDPAALRSFAVGTPITVSLEGRVRHTGAPDRIVGTFVRVPTPGANVDEGILHAMELAAVIEAGVVRPLRVTQQAAFTRATGFVARAWPFLAIAAVLIALAAWLWLRATDSRPVRD